MGHSSVALSCFLESSTPTGSPPSDANTKHKVPFDFAQGRLSTPQIIAFAMISSGRDDRVGMFTRHRLGPTNKLDCPHAMGLEWAPVPHEPRVGCGWGCSMRCTPRRRPCMHAVLHR